MSAPSEAVPPGTAPSASTAGDETAPEHLEFVNRVSKLPFVQGACEDALNYYNEKKNTSQGAFQWSLQTAEDTAKYAVGMVKPIVQTLPINPNGVIDRTLCNAVDYVESFLPFVQKQPKEVFQDAKERATQAKEYATGPCNAVKSLQEQSWKQVNVMLETERGKRILGVSNKLITTAEDLLKYLLPHGSNLLNYHENVDKLARIIMYLADLPVKMYRPLVERITSSYTRYSSEPSQPAAASGPAQEPAAQASELSQSSQPSQTSQPEQSSKTTQTAKQ